MEALTLPEVNFGLAKDVIRTATEEKLLADALYGGRAGCEMESGSKTGRYVALSKEAGLPKPRARNRFKKGWASATRRRTSSR